AVGGRLELAMSGPSLPPTLNYELSGQAKKVQQQIETAYAVNLRTVYLPVIRSGLFGLFKVFDFADPSVATSARGRTTVAPQALFMMNSDFVWDVSASAAGSLLGLCGGDARRI